MSRQRIILLITGFVLASIAVVMANIYLSRQREAIRAEEKARVDQFLSSQTTVLVAKKNLPEGFLIDADSVEPKIVPNQFVQPQAATSIDRIAGMMVVAPITTGEQITLTKLTQKKEKYGLSAMTPPGKRAITVNVDNIASLFGMIKPGDYVDVIANLIIPIQSPDGKQTNQPTVVPLFQNVLVLAVGKNIGGSAEASSRYTAPEESPLITLALTPHEANLIAFVQEQGKIRLVLRSHADAEIQQQQIASWETLFQYITPKGSTDGQTTSIDYVEIYRGLNKERVPLTQ
ncbi:MAG: Flp pilus assembly protein CpaB [Candidatus Omnitrophica bacterium]|nr:Flp pilus assembly protein CpaB [Candidatus Omnitrophota bacterium]